MVVVQASFDGLRIHDNSIYVWPCSVLIIGPRREEEIGYTWLVWEVTYPGLRGGWGGRESYPGSSCRPIGWKKTKEPAASQHHPSHSKLGFITVKLASLPSCLNWSRSCQFSIWTGCSRVSRYVTWEQIALKAIAENHRNEQSSSSLYHRNLTFHPPSSIV